VSLSEAVGGSQAAWEASDRGCLGEYCGQRGILYSFCFIDTFTLLHLYITIPSAPTLLMQVPALAWQGIWAACILCKHAFVCLHCHRGKLSVSPSWRRRACSCMFSRKHQEGGARLRARKVRRGENGGGRRAAAGNSRRRSALLTLCLRTL